MTTSTTNAIVTVIFSQPQPILEAEPPPDAGSSRELPENPALGPLTISVPSEAPSPFISLRF